MAPRDRRVTYASRQSGTRIVISWLTSFGSLGGAKCHIRLVGRWSSAGNEEHPGPEEPQHDGRPPVLSEHLRPENMLVERPRAIDVAHDEQLCVTSMPSTGKLATGPHLVVKSG